MFLKNYSKFYKKKKKITEINPVVTFSFFTNAFKNFF